MGYMTLGDFRAELRSAIGTRTPALTDPRVDRWVNFAYLDIVGAVKFEELERDDTSTSTNNGFEAITLPALAAGESLLEVELVKDIPNDTLLQWVPKNEYWRLKQTPTGKPLKWTRRRQQLLFNPVPNGAYLLRIIMRVTPARLTGVNDVTSIPFIWDQAVHLLSTSYALMGLGEEERAAFWLQRAVAYIASRLTEDQIKDSTRALGLTLPILPEKLMAERAMPENQ